MTDRAKHLILAILLVTLTVVLGRASFYIPGLAQANLLLSTPPPATELSFSLPDQSETLSVSSQSEVLFFDLEASGPYALRYMTLIIDAKDLVLPGQANEWKIYTAEDQKVDYKNQVGYGEFFEGDLLRLRFYSDPAQGFQGSEGSQEFALVAPLYKSGEEALLKLTFPLYLPEDFDWEWVGFANPSAWMQVDPASFLGADAVEGLPSPLWTKR